MLKWLLVALAVGVGIWLWRRSRLDSARGEQPPPASRQPAEPQAMVACVHCGVHLPQAEAITGTQGAYCCPAHRRAHEAD